MLIQSKVSVIIPVYNGEKFLKQCLNSVLKQTYSNLEIIAVDDGSTDNSASILNEYALKDSRIKIIKHEKNKGLYIGRITGVKNATGDYLCFVDADDEIAVDWIRLLVKAIREEESDIVVGNTVNVKKDKKYYYNNALSFTRFRKPLIGKELIKEFFKQDGSCYHWHTVWNKLYRKDLWERALPYLEKQTCHLVMTEDIAFTTVIFYFSKKAIFKNIDCYFYNRHEEASTGKPKSEKNLINIFCDVSHVFEFLKEFFDNLSDGKEYLEGLNRLRDKYYRLWCHNVITDYPGNKSLQKSIISFFNKEKIEDIHDYDFYFYQSTTEWNSNYENLKAMIINKQYTLISFDIFDTLILRPFWRPSDMFVLMSKPAANLLGISNTAQFIEMRKNAEYVARSSVKDREDITIDEIYEQLGIDYGVSKDICDKLRDMEIGYELKFCQRRESGIELLEMAQAIGKSTILISDMYLKKETVQELLNKLNIKGFEELYLSSDVGLLKNTGNLYKYVFKKRKIQSGTMLHIGDNYSTDVNGARQVGCESLFFAKTTEIFTNSIKNIFTGNCFLPYSQNNNTNQRTAVAIKDFPIRTILAIVANKFFDKPNYSFKEESDFNGDMFFIGYYILGFFMLGLSKWLQKSLSESECKEIKFLARDGFLPKQVFDKLCKTDKRFSDIKTDYFYVSRKSLMPYSMHTELDFYSIASYINLVAHSGESILKLMKNVLLPLTEERAQEYIKKGIKLNAKFKNYNDFSHFINAMLEISYDEKKYKESVEKVKKYFIEKFTDTTALFDVGYSGKLPQIIISLCEKKLDAYFIHNAAGSFKIAADNGFTIKNFLDFTPAVSGVVMEYFLSSVDGSCIGYDLSGNEIRPVIEKEENTYEYVYPIKTIQQGTIEFINDFINIFEDYQEQFEYNNYEIFAPMLYFLCNGKEFDYRIFNLTKLEDELHGGKSEIGFLNIHNYYLTSSNLINKTGERTNVSPVKVKYLPNPAWSRKKKALYYLLFDKKTFWRKIQQIRKR